MHAYIHTIQIEDILTDEARVVEKSRFPLSESQRVDKSSLPIDGHSVDDDENEDGEEEEEDMEVRDRGKQSKAFDLEVYDDRNFYSQLLKVVPCMYIHTYVDKLDVDDGSTTDKRCCFYSCMFVQYVCM